MNVVDIVILLLLIVSAIQGFRTGLIRSVFSLCGLVLGIVIAGWNYGRFAGRLTSVVHNFQVAEAISFCLIALLVMLIAGLAGMLLKGLIDGVGLGWLDRLTGLAFGLLRGALLVTLCVVTLAAFFPNTRWLGDAQLARYFLGSAHLTTSITPSELKARILDGLRVVETHVPEWLREK